MLHEASHSTAGGVEADDRMDVGRSFVSETETSADESVDEYSTFMFINLNPFTACPLFFNNDFP